jgi:hypothetical protein
MDNFSKQRIGNSISSFPRCAKETVYDKLSNHIIAGSEKPTRIPEMTIQSIKLELYTNDPVEKLS